MVSNSVAVGCVRGVGSSKKLSCLKIRVYVPFGFVFAGRVFMARLLK